MEACYGSDGFFKYLAEGGGGMPFANERNRYLRYCAERGATPGSLKIKRNELLWIALRLGPDVPSEGIDIEVLRGIAIERQQAREAVTAAQRVCRYRTTLASVPRLVA
jgi:hypothetical protein